MQLNLEESRANLSQEISLAPSTTKWQFKHLKKKEPELRLKILFVPRSKTHSIFIIKHEFLIYRSYFHCSWRNKQRTNSYQQHVCLSALGGVRLVKWTGHIFF